MPDVSIRRPRLTDGVPAAVWSAMTSRHAVFVIAVCAGYYLTGLFALLIRFSHTGIAVIWAPNAVLLAALLLTPARLWWVYVLGILPTHVHLVSHFQAGVTPAVILAQYAGNITQALLAAIMLRCFGGSLPRFGSLEGMTRYIALAAIAAPAVASVLAIALFQLAGWVSTFGVPWRQRFFGNVFPALTVTPLIVMAAQRGVASTLRASASRRVEFALLLIALFAVGIPVLGISVATRLTIPGLLVYAMLPLLLWAAIRFGTGGLSLSLLVVAVVVVWDAIQGRGPFVLSERSPDNVLALQVFLLGLSLPLQLVAALVEEREQTAEAFRASELRYRDVVDTQSELICRFLPDTTLTFVNDAYCRFWNKTRKELIGTRFLELIPESARDMARAHIDSETRRLRTEFHEHEVLLPDGKIGWQEWINHVICDSRGNVIELQGIGRDITERRRVENSLRETRSELERVTRVTALGELAASIAHEVNQPLAAIAANANACVRWLGPHSGPD
jgi:PAS domain S-box-containing protein